MLVDLFIYYRLAPDCDHAKASGTLRAMQTEVAAATGVHGRLMVRRDDAHTWMEIYAGVMDTATFESTLEAAWQRHGLSAFIETGTARHCERFVECA